jgi:hypothetical protein
LPCISYIVGSIIFLNVVVNVGIINFQIDVGRVYMYLNFVIPKSTRILQMFMLHKRPWGNAIFEKCVFMFNLEAPIRLKVLIWCTLKILPLKYPMGRKLISYVGKIMGKDHNNCKGRNPRFCAMDPKKRWFFHNWILGGGRWKK